MDYQTIIVALIILAALSYGGLSLFRKINAFKSNSSCGTDCGCGDSAKVKLHKIKSQNPTRL